MPNGKEGKRLQVIEVSVDSESEQDRTQNLDDISNSNLNEVVSDDHGWLPIDVTMNNQDTHVGLDSADLYACEEEERRANEQAAKVDEGNRNE